MRKSFAALALLCVSAAPASTNAGIDPAQMPEVVKVQCRPGSGSAFYVGPDILLSVAHVTTLAGCFINGAPFKVLRQEGDFTILKVAEPVDRWLHIDCGGYHAAHLYTAWGFARGLPTLTSIDIVATGQTVGDFSRLWGVFNVIPGQSGGPIVDAASGRVVGTVNVYNAGRGDSGSVAIRDTSICKDIAHA